MVNTKAKKAVHNEFTVRNYSVQPINLDRFFNIKSVGYNKSNESHLVIWLGRTLHTFEACISRCVISALEKCTGRSK